MRIQFDYTDFRERLLSRHKSVIDILKISSIVGPNNIYIAGGIVRNFFSGDSILINDVDLFFSEEGYKIFTKLQMSYGTIVSNQFGSERWYPEKNNNIYYDIIKISDFYHGLWKCEDIIDVLNQFDITVNALAVDLFNGEFFNPVNGLRDIKKQELRAIRFDFPEMSVSKEIPISRNSVLWFRYNHYSSKLGYKIESVTEEWINANKYRVDDINVFAKYFFNPTII